MKVYNKAKYKALLKDAIHFQKAQVEFYHDSTQRAMKKLKELQEDLKKVK